MATLRGLRTLGDRFLTWVDRRRVRNPLLAARVLVDYAVLLIVVALWFASIWTVMAAIGPLAAASIQLFQAGRRLRHRPPDAGPRAPLSFVLPIP